MFKKLLNKLGYIHRSELNNFPRGLVKRWDEFREDVNLLSEHLGDDDFWLLNHFQQQDAYFAYLYKLCFGEDFYQTSTKKQPDLLEKNGCFLRKAFWEKEY